MGFNQVEEFRDKYQRELYAKKKKGEVREYKKTGKYKGKNRKQIEN